MTDKTPTQRVGELVKHERHHNMAETQYWFDQYKLAARQLAADLEATQERERQLGFRARDAEAKLAAAQRALAERNAVVDNLATMLRRMIWLANKLDGDVGIKATAGKAKQLLHAYGLQGNSLREDAAAIRTEDNHAS